MCHLTFIQILAEYQFYYLLLLLAFQIYSIFGKGVIPHPLSRSTPPKILPFPEIQDVPIFHRPIRKTKVLNESFNQFLHKFYPQSILILEEYLLNW